jgi:hypothetical protein
VSDTGAESSTLGRVVVRCTKKLLDLLGRAVTPTMPPLGDDDWYANLLWIDRRKCLLLVHAHTLFPVFRADVRAGNLRPFGRYVVGAVEEELRAEGLPLEVLGPLDADDVHIAPTARRSVLGFMNEMAVHLRYQIERHGGIDACDTRLLNYRQRRMLHNRAGVYSQPLDLVAERLQMQPYARLLRQVVGTRKTSKSRAAKRRLFS